MPKQMNRNSSNNDFQYVESSPVRGFVSQLLTRKNGVTAEYTCSPHFYPSHHKYKMKTHNYQQHLTSLSIQPKGIIKCFFPVHSRRAISFVHHIYIFVVLFSSYILVSNGLPTRQDVSNEGNAISQSQVNLPTKDFVLSSVTEDYSTAIQSSPESNQADLYKWNYRSDGRRRRRYHRLYQEAYKQQTPKSSIWSMGRQWFRRMLKSSTTRGRDKLQTDNSFMQQQGVLFSEKKREEISRFAEQTVQHFSLRADPRHVAFYIYQWEIYRLRMMAEMQHNYAKLMQKRLYQQKQLSEKLREEAEKNARKISQAKTFDEFKQIIFGSSASEVKAARRDNPQMPVQAIIGPRLEHPVPELPNVISASSSKLQFPKATGGGVMVKVYRSTRDIKPEAYATKAVQSEKERSDDEEQALEDEVPDASEEELKAAFESRTEFNQTGCQAERRTLCTSSFLGLRPEQSPNIVPPGFHVQRCGDSIMQSTCPAYLPINQDEYAAIPLYRLQEKIESNEAILDRQRPSCHCLSSDQECLPTKVVTKVQPVGYPSKQGNWSSDLIVVTEHLSCSCQPRCQNRKCFAPLQLKISTIAHCSCVCEPNDARCRRLLEGEERFRPDEIPVPLPGSFILPPCRYGPMDDYHIFHRRCPRKLPFQMGSDQLG